MRKVVASGLLPCLAVVTVPPTVYLTADERLQRYFRFGDLGSGEDSGIASRSTQDAYSMLEPSSTNPVGDPLVTEKHGRLFMLRITDESKSSVRFCTFPDCK